MHTCIPLAEAAGQLAKQRRVSESVARRTLIAALIEEKLAARCEAYWRDSMPPINAEARRQHNHRAEGAIVPADFWRMEHAEHFDMNSKMGGVPTGPWGFWGRVIQTVSRLKSI